MALLSKLKSGAFMSLGLLATASWAAEGDSRYNLREGATEISHRIVAHHNWVVVIMLVIAIIVFGVMAISMVIHRKAKHPVPAKFSHSTFWEILWTLIPFAILIWLAIPATKLLMDEEDPSKSDVTIVVKGYQWKWRYTYQDEGIEYFSNLATKPETFRNDSHLASTPLAALGKVLSETPFAKGDQQSEKGTNYLLEVDNELVIPVGKKVRFLITADDVIHAWFMPDFGVKKDAIPGFVNEAWARVEKPGTYRGQCAELCGKDHGFMPIVVRAVPEEEFVAWIAQKKEEKRLADLAAEEAAKSSWTMDKLMAEGEKHYAEKCAACHQASGLGMPPTFPALQGSKIATGPVKDHINIVLNGKNAMPAWAAQLTDVELATIITYERNAWGNNTGDLVQPADIAAAKQGQ